MGKTKSTNSEAIQFQKEQAEEAFKKEQDRTARLEKGKAAIDALFKGGPIMGTRDVDKVWNTGVVPQGFTTTRIPKAATATAAAPGAAAAAPSVSSYYSNAQPGGYGGDNAVYGDASYGTLSGGDAPPAQPRSATTPGYNVNASAGSSGPVYGNDYEDVLVGPDGKIIHANEVYGKGTEDYDTGKTSDGFDDSFYGNYKQAILNYYQPEVAKQFDEANSDLTGRLADRGLLHSSVAGQKRGKLAAAQALQNADVVKNADDQVGALKDTVAKEKQGLIDQLYSTEDPTLTADMAVTAANGLNLKTPDLTPNAAFVNPALTALASGYASYTSPYGTTGGAAPSTYGTRAPLTTKGSGKGYGGE